LESIAGSSSNTRPEALGFQKEYQNYETSYKLPLALQVHFETEENARKSNQTDDKLATFMSF